MKIIIIIVGVIILGISFGLGYLYGFNNGKIDKNLEIKDGFLNSKSNPLVEVSKEDVGIFQAVKYESGVSCVLTDTGMFFAEGCLSGKFGSKVEIIRRNDGNWLYVNGSAWMNKYRE